LPVNVVTAELGLCIGVDRAERQTDAQLLGCTQVIESCCFKAADLDFAAVEGLAIVDLILAAATGVGAGCQQVVVVVVVEGDQL